MSTSINIKDDLTSYLSSSNHRSDDNKFSKLFSNGTAKVSGWLYSPLNQINPDDQSNDELNQEANTKKSWFESANDDPFFPSLSRTQRIIGFAVCIGMGMTCFTLVRTILDQPRSPI